MVRHVSATLFTAAKPPPDTITSGIGVFDSGLGGLSVLSRIREILPHANLLYVADRARAPYGSRSLESVKEMSHEIVEWLIARGAGTIVVACNTASAAALDSLRAAFVNIPFVGMEPAVKPAARDTPTGVIGVLATEATFQGRLFRSVVDRHAGGSKVIARACPRWVELVEEGHLSGPVVEEAVRLEIEPLLAAGANPLVLGCTHFTFLAPVISRLAGGVGIIDPSAAVAAQTSRVAGPIPGTSRTILAASGDIGEFATLAWEVAGIKALDPVLPFPS